MSTKTSFKRLALGVVVAIGLGFLSNTPSQAVVSDEVLTLSGTTGLTAVVNESTTAVTATLTFFLQPQMIQETFVPRLLGQLVHLHQFGSE